jgi:transcriptional regulator with XRE-family HTH domain
MQTIEPKKVGDLLRQWRERRHLSQLNLAYEIEISQKHLSFLEIGRSQPSREMVLRLAEHLNIPLRERNVLLTSAGFASVFPERSLDDDSLPAARRAVDLILNGLEPNPSFAVDRHWTLVSANQAAKNVLLADVDPSLLEPPVNMLRLCLHPKGFTPQVMNYSEWRGSIFRYLERQVEATADSFLIELLQELKSYPKPESARNAPPTPEIANSGISIPLRLMKKEGELSFISTVTVFGTPIDVTLSELAIESFFPVDKRTQDALISKGVKRMLDVILKRFEAPDETRLFEKGKFEIVHIGGMTIGRASYEPGWKWSEHVSPIAGTPFCEVEHVGLVLSGRATVAMIGGGVVELTAGTLFYVPPAPHDSWVIGDELYVSLHFLGTDQYAK